MKVEIIALITTSLLGIFILIGAFIAFFVSKKKKFVDFSLGLAISVIVMLIITDLIPEVFEMLWLKYIWLALIGIIVGYFVLKLLDRFIPAHEHHHDTFHIDSEDEVEDNLVHVGIISSVALILHNIIEGMAVYSTTVSDNNAGLMLALGIGLHNIPIGIVIVTTFYQSRQNAFKTSLIVFAVALSTVVGGLVMLLLNNIVLSDILLGILLSITIGMLIYIVINELFPRFKAVEYVFLRNVGLILGIIILLISMLI